MKGSDTKAKGPPSADFLVCFPSRSRLTLMPKPICSPARPSEPNNRHRHHHFIKKLRARNGAGAGQASPLLWAKNKQMVSEITEPTSPKVTCAGQIKVRSKTRSCKSWQSVMEEIERIRNNKKRFGWVESLGFKKEVMQFLTCFRLRSIRFDFQCFGSFPRPDINTEDEDVKDVEHQENHNHADGKETSRTMFSKWLMVLQENESNGIFKEEKKTHDVDDDDQTAAPPPNALLLMRCRSAPAKSWLKDEENLGNDKDEECERKLQKKTKNLRSLMEEERLVVLKYDPGFFRAGGLNDPLSRCPSRKR